MTGTHDPLPTPTEAAAQQLLETWEQLGHAHKVIGGGCSCGAHTFLLGIADFEQDIGDYLRNEGEQHQRRDVLALLDDAAREGDQWSVAKLLTRLCESCAPIDADAAAFVMERLSRTLQSFDQLHRGR